MSDSIFSPAALAKAVHTSLDEATAAIPQRKSHVLILDGSRADGARLLYAQKIRGKWEVGMEAEWKGHGLPAGKVTALKAW